MAKTEDKQCVVSRKSLNKDNQCHCVNEAKLVGKRKRHMIDADDTGDMNSDSCLELAADGMKKKVKKTEPCDSIHTLASSGAVEVTQPDDGVDMFIETTTRKSLPESIPIPFNGNARRNCSKHLSVSENSFAVNSEQMQGRACVSQKQKGSKCVKGRNSLPATDDDNNIVSKPEATDTEIQNSNKKVSKKKKQQLISDAGQQESNSVNNIMSKTEAVVTEIECRNKKTSKKKKQRKECCSGESAVSKPEATDTEIQSSKKKKQHQSVQSQPISVAGQKQSNPAQYHALEYLRKWKNHRNSWTFQKVRQVWLLQHMYDTAKVSDDDFIILVEYLENLTGRAREQTAEEAEKLISDADETTVESADNAKQQLSEEQFDRIRQVLQILS